MHLILTGPRASLGLGFVRHRTVGMLISKINLLSLIGKSGNGARHKEHINLHGVCGDHFVQTNLFQNGTFRRACSNLGSSSYGDLLSLPVH